MWFKQAQIFQLSSLNRDSEILEKQLALLEFKACLPSFPFSYGWVSPLEQENAPLVHVAHGCMLICMQLEEKILPAVVVRQELQENIKRIEAEQNRKVSSKEKRILKDEIVQTLLPRAFSKLTRIYAYIDIKNTLLIIDTTTVTKIEKFLELFKKSQNDFVYSALNIQRMSPILTRWLVNQESLAQLSIEKTAVLVDQNQKNRMIRCQQQDLYASGILEFLKDGCEVAQISLNWQDLLNFTLSDELSLKNIKYQDKVLDQAKEHYGESIAQRFDTDFVIMTGLLSQLITLLRDLFLKPEKIIEEVYDYSTN